jgi:hypothetical protein
MKPTSKEYYEEVLKSGMFFEWYPELTGDWSKDESTWVNLQTTREEPSIRVEITRTPAFTEIWHEGSVTMGDKKYMFWLINPTGKDEEGREYEIEIRWWFKQVPVAIRSMSTQIINDFKTTQNDTRTS